MRVVEVREGAIPIASAISNADIDFSQMDASVVSIETDSIRDGRPVVGYGFNPNGRYAQSGQLGERFIPRLVLAKSAEILRSDGENLDPAAIWSVLMTNEKPGGRGERSVAVRVLYMTIWSLVAKIAASRSTCCLPTDSTMETRIRQWRSTRRVITITRPKARRRWSRSSRATSTSDKRH